MRIQNLIFAVGLLALAGALGAGAAISWRTEGRLPPVGWSYPAYITELVSEHGDYEGAVREMRSAAYLDMEGGSIVLSHLAGLAHATGDRENELFALRRLAYLNDTQLDAHNRLTTALLATQELDPAILDEAGHHAELALELGPSSALAHINGGKVALARGEQQAAFDHWQRALELDARRSQTSLGGYLRSRPELASEFRAYLEISGTSDADTELPGEAQ